MARQAVVIGSGPNGLVGAVVLARAGFEVVVHEAASEPGGGTRSAELTLPGFVHDVCSAIHPLSRVSPAFRELGLELDWVEPPACAAHPLDDGTAVVLERSVDETAAGLGPDADAYRALVGPLAAGWREIEPVLVGPYPPAPRSLWALARRLGAAGAARTLRDALGDARSVADRSFSTERARTFFAGHAAHSMLPLERRPSAGFALALLVLGHVAGWGFPRGGAGAIAAALVAELERLGGGVRTSSPVDALPRADVVLADVVPRELVRIAAGRLPEPYERSLRRYRHGPGAFKLDWALDGPIPWTAEGCRRAATVHLGGGFDEIARSEWEAWRGGRRTGPPSVILAQHTPFDPGRAPAGRHTGWAYCHVPNGDGDDMTEAVEAQVERFAPGFRSRILARSALGPAGLEAHDRNLVGGDVNGGAQDLAQLVFRPVRTRFPYRTPLPGVYLCSSSTPPGGGVHGMCGYAAAKLALRDAG